MAPSSVQGEGLKRQSRVSCLLKEVVPSKAILKHPLCEDSRSTSVMFKRKSHKPSLRSPNATYNRKQGVPYPSFLLCPL